MADGFMNLTKFSITPDTSQAGSTPPQAADLSELADPFPTCMQQVGKPLALDQIQKGSVLICTGKPLALY